jgi:nucleotide-binding universal stress UspA family protein
VFKKVLVPLDGSALAECTLPYIKKLIKDGAVDEITLLNVVLINFDWYEVKEDFNFSVFRENLLTESQKYLGEVKYKCNPAGIKVKTESVEGNFPAQTITDYSRRNSVDMIVMSTHGRTGKKILMFGSTALSVLHDSHVPVLLIRPESCRT